MAAEFIRIGRVTRCREVNRSIDANGNMVEVWGDFLPLAYCGHDGRIVNRTNRLLMGGSQLGRDENGHNFSRPEDIVLDAANFEPPVFEPPVTDDRSLSSESKFLLIAAAVGLVLLGLVFAFKK